MAEKNKSKKKNVKNTKGCQDLESLPMNVAMEIDSISYFVAVTQSRDVVSVFKRFKDYQDEINDKKKSINILKELKIYIMTFLIILLKFDFFINYLDFEKKFSLWLEIYLNIVFSSMKILLIKIIIYDAKIGIYLRLISTILERINIYLWNSYRRRVEE